LCTGSFQDGKAEVLPDWHLSVKLALLFRFEVLRMQMKATLAKWVIRSSGLLVAWLTGLLLLLVPASLLAEDAAITVTPEARISLFPLTGQTLTDSATVTVQPRDAGSPGGAFSEALPKHCLMSVTVTLGADEADLRAGKMICITEDRRVFELTPTATISDLGLCQAAGGAACGRYVVGPEQPGLMVLTVTEKMTLQARSDQN
jgi:hypothetical protein